MKAPEIQTSRLRLQLWRDEHLVPFRSLCADARVMEFYPSTLSSTECDQTIARARTHFDNHGFGIWELELKDSGRFVGFTGLQMVPFQAHFTPAVELGWRLAFDDWNKGYATDGPSLDRFCL